MPFIRVRGASPGDPLHEFDVSVAEVERHPDLYVVVDKTPVLKARNMTVVEGTVPQTPKTKTTKVGPSKPPAAKRAAKSTAAPRPKPGETTTAPAGADS